MLECVVNISEGRDFAVLGEIVAGGGDHVLDVHVDSDHNRSVVTLAGPDLEEVVRRIARTTVETLDIRSHDGVHPRLGVLDVVPFVPIGEDGSAPTQSGQATPSNEALGDAVAARDLFASWVAEDLGVPCFIYGPERRLPEIRRRAFIDMDPDFGPAAPHPTAGACAVGARFVLVAYNLWLTTKDLAIARAIARDLRNPRVRALGLPVGEATQVSCNLLDPMGFGPDKAYDAVSEMAAGHGTELTRAELVGLMPLAVLKAVPTERYPELDLDRSRTIEGRLATARRRSGGS